MSLLNPGQGERRRSPRFSCGGEARIIRLPWDGVFLPARVRDLSLGGCCLDVPSRLDCGMRAEVVLRVNSEAFRAVGRVLNLRDRFGVGVEFLQLTTGGRESLQDLIRRLERLQAHLNQMKSAREEDQQEILMQEIDQQGLKSYLLRGRIPLIRTILPAEKPQSETRDTRHPETVLGDAEEVTLLDIFI